MQKVPTTHYLEIDLKLPPWPRFKGNELSLLPSIGCRTVHGYLNGKPGPMVVTIDGSVLIINTQECDQ